MPIEERARHLPLKRGTACLNCRERRVRCSGQKPHCQQCLDFNFVCEYMEGKPPSKVKQLEDKVAQLTEMLRAYSANDNPSSASDQHPSVPSSSNDMSHVSLDNGMSNVGAATTSPLALNGRWPGPQQLDSAPNSTGTVPGSDISPPIPAFLGIMAPDSADQGATGNSDQALLEEADFLRFLETFSNADQSNQPSPAHTDPSPQNAYAGQMPPSLSSIPLAPNGTTLHFPSSSKMNSPPATMYGDTPSLPMPFRDLSAHPPEAVHGSTSNSTPSDHQSSSSPGYTRAQAPSLSIPQPDMPRGSTEVSSADMQAGDWLDPENVTSMVRDHLLQIFFSTTKMFPQAFHVPRFLNRVHLPEPKCPHPCLLYTMYTFAASQTKCPTIRNAEERFHEIALIRLQESILKHDRILDAIRAATMLGIYKQMQGDFIEGWLMNGQAARLALSCGLHQIPSRKFDKALFESDNAQRSAFSVIPTAGKLIASPSNPVELGEYIWAFWCTYTTDRCGAVLSQSPPVIPEELVTTPFPRPLSDFELGLARNSTEGSIASLFSPVENVKIPPRDFDRSLLVDLGIKGLTILARIVKLPESVSQPPRSTTQSPSFDHSPVSIPPGPADIVSAPLAEISRALLDLNSQLPSPLRVDWEAKDVEPPNLLDKESGLQADFMSLFYILGTSWLLLQGHTSSKQPKLARLRTGSRLTLGMKIAMNESEIMSNVDSFSFILWTIIARVLMGEIAASKGVIDPSLSARLITDIETCMQCIKLKGLNIPSLKGQLQDLDGMWLAIQTAS